MYKIPPGGGGGGGSIASSRPIRFYLSYDIKNTLKSHFWRKIVIILSLCTQRCDKRHNISRKSVNHYSCIEFIARSCLKTLSVRIQMIKNPCSNHEIHVLFEHGY